MQYISIIVCTKLLTSPLSFLGHLPYNKYMSRITLVKVFISALLVRIIYSIAAPSICLNDTGGYYNIGMNLFQHPSLQALIMPYRTPVYPIFLNAVMYILGVGGTEFSSPSFLWGAQVVVAIQMVIGAIAFTVFYQILARLLPKRTHLLFTICLLFDVFVIGWERTLMTEGLAISVSIGITTVLLHILLAPSGKKFILLGCLFVFGFLLRPSFIIFPIATLPLVAWYFRKNGRLVFWACVTLAATSAVPLVYARINYANYNYFGIQFVGDINVLGRILELNIPIESAKTNTYFYTTVKDSRTTTNIIQPFRFLEYYDVNIYSKIYRLIELQAFNQTVILHNLPLYLVKTMGTIPEVLLEVCDFTLVSPKTTNLLTNIVWMLQQGYGYAQYATLVIPFLWIFMSIVFVIKPTRWHAIVCLIGTIAMSQIVLTALVVYKDADRQYGRLTSVVRPQLFLFLFLCAVSFVRMYQKRRI
jgi:hypothetical protein